MRHALIVASDYSENGALVARPAFPITGEAFAERLARDDTGFSVTRLDANRELPERLEEFLTANTGRLETLIVHFSGYLAFKTERGPAMLLDGPRLRAFPLSRLHAALAAATQQSLVICDAVGLDDGQRTMSELVPFVGHAVQNQNGALSSLTSLHPESSSNRPGVRRLTDLWLLALDEVARLANGGLGLASAVYATMQHEKLGFSEIPALEYRPGYYDFVLLQGPRVGGVAEDANAAEQTSTEPATDPLLQAAPTEVDDDSSPTLVTDTLSLIESPIRDTVPGPDTEGSGAFSETEAATEGGHVASQDEPDTTREAVDLDAETPRPAAANWGADAAYFPSAPPPPVEHAHRPPLGTLPGVAPLAPIHIGEQSTEHSIPTAFELPEAASAAVEPSELPSHTADRIPSVLDTDPVTLALDDADRLMYRGDAAAALPNYEWVLGQLASLGDERLPSVYARIGDAQRAQNQGPQALLSYEQALTLDPRDEVAFDGACELYRHAGDFEGLVVTLRRRIGCGESLEARLDLLDNIVEIWATETNELPRAIETLEERLSLREDLATLERLVELDDLTGDPTSRILTRERLLTLIAPASEQSALILLESARIAATNLEDCPRAVELLERAQQAEPTSLEVLETSVELLTNAPESSALVRLHEQALTACSETERAEDIAGRMLALLEAPEHAQHLTTASLVQLAKVGNASPERTALVVQALLSRDQLELAATTLGGALERDPRHPAMLEQLSELLSNQGDVERAANVASVRVSCGDCPPALTERAAALELSGLPLASRVLGAPDYTGRLYPASLNRELTEALGALEPVLVASGAVPAPPKGTVPKDATILDPATSTATLARSMAWTARFLGIEVPQLVVVPEHEFPLALVPGKSPQLLLTRALGSGLSLTELGFLGAQQLVLLRPSFVLRSDLGVAPPLSSVLEVLLILAREGEDAVKKLPAEQKKLGKRLDVQLEMEPELKPRLSELDAALKGEADLGACAQLWLESIDRTRLRVALLACADPSHAIALCRKWPMVSPLSLEQQLDELAQYACSPAYAELRRELGLALGQPTQ